MAHGSRLAASPIPAVFAQFPVTAMILGNALGFEQD
jgi:hypothetical protein